MSWKTLMLLTGSDSPVVVVLSGSMEPSFFRGDILFLTMGDAPVRTGEIVVYNADNKAIPVVHRVIQLHERRNSNYVDILTKVCSSPSHVAAQSCAGSPLQLPLQYYSASCAFSWTSWCPAAEHLST
jgi:signal peptidase I